MCEMTDGSNSEGSKKGCVHLRQQISQVSEIEDVDEQDLPSTFHNSSNGDKDKEDNFSDIGDSNSIQDNNENRSQFPDNFVLEESSVKKQEIGGINDKKHSSLMNDKTQSLSHTLLNKIPVIYKGAIDLDVVVDVKNYQEDQCQENGSYEENKGQDCELEPIFKKSDLIKKESNQCNNGSTFASICSLFQILRSGGNNTNQKVRKNNERPSQELHSSISYQNNFLSESVSCCPPGTPNIMKKSIQPYKLEKVTNPASKIAVIDVSPKPKSKVFSDVILSQESSQNKDKSEHNNISSLEGTSFGIAPLASPEQVSSTGSFTSEVINSVSSSSADYGDYFTICSASKSLVTALSNIQTKLKLIHEGDISLCFLNHSKTIISKVLNSKFLRRWEMHHIYLKDDSICSKIPIGTLESSISYSNVQEIYTVGRWEQSNQYCVTLVIPEGSIVLQANTPFIRDQWLSSILWKKNMHRCRNILQSSTRFEIILKEIKNLIQLTLDSPLQDDCIINVPVEIISKVLDENEIWTDRKRREEVITALEPLLEKITPSTEMFQFFSQHCLFHPRSPVILEVFTSVVQRILKRTFDFGKSLLMRKFAADYLISLYLQNDGDEAVRKFLLSIHGPNYECPHPRVLQNLVAVNLAAIFSHFEHKKVLAESNNEESCSQGIKLLDKQLECCITVFRIISEFGDWRPGLAQLLQPIPFPDDALCHETFIEGFTPVIKRIGTDPRCEVHEMVLGIRENKEGWLNVYCPSSFVCRDEGELWCEMLQTLIVCCCRRKGFLQRMMKHLGALILVALRGHDIAQEILCLMLEWRLVPSEDQEMQVVTALESTESGRIKYSDLCKRQEHLRHLQLKRGPRKLTLPSRSTDTDVAQLLSSGSFGNLECLSLAFTHVTSSCANHLIQLPTLRYLNLWATHFGDAGLVVIAEHLDKLQVLNLCETPVTDKGISALAGLKNLKKLNLNSTKLSPETIEILKQKLPALQELDVRYTDAW